MAMRDGVLLSADVYIPSEGIEGGPYPALLMRTPYNNQTAHYMNEASFFAEHGYAVVLQDVRGRHDSLGEWYPFRNEGPDGYDSIEWTAQQEWCNGKVGTFGGSYGGWYQWVAARERPPHLTTMVSTAAGGRWMREIPYNNGLVALVMLGWLNLAGARTMQDSSRVDWEEVFYHLPLRTMDEKLGRPLPVWQEWLDHPTVDDYWEPFILSDDDLTKIDLPILHITGWYDDDQPGALFFYEGMIRNSPARDKQFIRIGPWDHGGTRIPRQVLGGVDFSVKALVNIEELHVKWFDRWMKDESNGVADRKRSEYFLMGVNEWQESETWPPEEAKGIAFYFHSGGKANTLMGDGQLGRDRPGEEVADTYTYNPEDPVIPVVNTNFSSDPPIETPLDRRFVLRRDDVLVYASDPLGIPLEVAGRPWVTLFASSDCPDTDWVAELSDVYPDGHSIQLGQGVLRARYRESLEFESLLEPNEVYEFKFELMTIAHVFQPGHRVRLSVTSSYFPYYDRNPNTGHPIGQDAEMRMAQNTVHHSREHASHVLLPVMPSHGIALGSRRTSPNQTTRS